MDTNILFVKADTFASAMITSGSYSSPNAALIDSAILDACFSLQNLEASESLPYLSPSGEEAGYQEAEKEEAQVMGPSQYGE